MSDEDENDNEIMSEEDTPMVGKTGWLDDENDDDDDEEDTGKETMVMNPTSVRERIDYALEILADFKSREDKSQSRVDIIVALSKDLSEYYGYINELSDFLLDLFSPSECVEYMDASDRPRPMVIRTNTIKSTRKDLMEALSKRGSTMEAVEWSKVAIKVTESSVPIGATPEYLAGYYMLQSAASLNPVMALDPQPGERILDMASAPGGKTSYIAQLMKNSGTVIANDLKPQRQKATVANLHRMGVKNTIVCCYDGRKIPKIMKGFDRVLLDAPCSGLGVISRDQTVKLQRTFKDIQRIAHLQKELLCAAIDAVDPTSKTGGVVVYSTCSISTEENEQVVNYILQKRFVRLVETGLEVGKPGLTRHKERRFHPSLVLTRRFYPHVHNMDGFYVAKFKKFANGARGTSIDEEEENEGGEEEEEEDKDDVEALRIASKAAATIERKENRKRDAATAAAASAVTTSSKAEVAAEGKISKLNGKPLDNKTKKVEVLSAEKSEVVKKGTKSAQIRAVPIAPVTEVAADVPAAVVSERKKNVVAVATPVNAKTVTAQSTSNSSDSTANWPKAVAAVTAKSPKVLAAKSPKVAAVAARSVAELPVSPAKVKVSRPREEDEEEPRVPKKRRLSIKGMRGTSSAAKQK